MTIAGEIAHATVKVVDQKSLTGGAERASVGLPFSHAATSGETAASEILGSRSASPEFRTSSWRLWSG